MVVPFGINNENTLVYDAITGDRIMLGVIRNSVEIYHL